MAKICLNCRRPHEGTGYVCQECIDTFPNLPGGVTLAEVCEALEKVQRFRQSDIDNRRLSQTRSMVVPRQQDKD